MADAPAGSDVRLQLDWRTGAYVIAAVLGALAVVGVISNTQSMLAPLGIGILIALALDPLADGLQRKLKLPRGLAVTVLAVGLLALAILLGAVLGPRAVSEASQFSEQLPKTLDEIEELPLIGDWARDNDLAQKVQDWLRQLPSRITDDRIAEVASSLVSGIVAIAIVSVVAVAVLIDGEDLVGRFRKLIPESRRPRADRVGQVLYRTIGRYFGGSIFVAFLQGVWVLTLGLILGVPLAPLAAIWAMLTSLIPQVGGFLGGTFFTLLASTQGITTALIAGVGFFVYMTTENNLIQPAIVGRSVDLSPPTTMVAAFIGAAVAGVPGALVATPLVGAAKQIYLEVRGKARPDPEEGLGFLGRLRNVFHRKKR